MTGVAHRDRLCGRALLAPGRGVMPGAPRPCRTPMQRLTSFLASSVLALVLSCVLAPGARAQPDETPAAAAEVDIDDQVAAALYDRGVFLLGTGDAANAKKMFVESLERSPEGPVAQDARAVLARANERLGLPPEHGIPTQEVLDPYGEPAPGGEVLDPYGEPAAGEVLDPYGQDAAPAAPAVSPAADADATARKGLLAWSGLYGLTLGLALGGPESDDGDVRGGAIALGLAGAAAGVGASYYLTGRRPLTAGQSAAIASAGTWGAMNLGLLGDVFTGDDSATNTVYKYVAAGGALGVGVGAWYAIEAEPSVGTVSFVNSLSSYGVAGGLLLGVALDPPRSEAYSLNAFFGSALGIAAGLYLEDEVEVSRRRMLLVDVGALAGAASPWVLLYPLIADDSTENDEQVAGLVSTLTMAGGAIAAWVLTDGYGADDEAASDAPTALLRRAGDGRWQLGLPLPRPMPAPALAPSSGGMPVGIDIAAGSF